MTLPFLIFRIVYAEKEEKESYNIIKIEYRIDFNKIKCYFNNMKGDERMEQKKLPAWVLGLEEEELTFIKKFILASGSLKEVASLYGVTYPTVRLRLDRLIQKIKLNEQMAEEPFIAMVKQLAIDEKMDFETAKLLITAYKKEKETK